MRCLPHWQTLDINPKARAGGQGTDDLRQASGYTLLELLLAIAVLLAILLIAIPMRFEITRRANEAAAIKSVQDIVQAQREYKAAYPALGYSCSLAALGGDPRTGPPISASAQLLPKDLSSGVKSGYLLAVKDCVREKIVGADRVTGYKITAAPETVGKKGRRGFCSDQSGIIKVDPTGGDNCTQELK
jgi:type IV pilus assembly protein PilA